jgi:hypothetical protein
MAVRFLPGPSPEALARALAGDNQQLAGISSLMGKGSKDDTDWFGRTYKSARGSQGQGKRQGGYDYGQAQGRVNVFADMFPNQTDASGRVNVFANMFGNQPNGPLDLSPPLVTSGPPNFPIPWPFG